MVENAPVITHQHGDLTIEGYSRAAVQTYVHGKDLAVRSYSPEGVTRTLRFGAVDGRAFATKV